MAKKSKNLALDADAVKRDEKYRKLHNINVSQLFNRFLSALPIRRPHQRNASKSLSSNTLSSAVARTSPVPIPGA
jgi:hypothetical protein